ncbi:Ger(x)C family spore germination protein [Salibacterium aidingense]|uniref:Ger(x)C family spore germination protein n=1 Tax=Salibacterium aidingense TaxID=384933 RepID=UPI003BE3B336
MRKLVLLFLLLCPICLLNGCKAKYELDEIAIVVAAGVDTHEDGVEVTFQITNPHGSAATSATEGGGGEDAAVYSFSASGRTMLDAVNNAKDIIPRELFFSHMYYMIISETFIQEDGLTALVDFIERDEEMRGQFPLFIAKDGPAKNILEVLTPLDENPAKTIVDEANVSSGEIGIRRDIKVNDVINWSNMPDRKPVLIGVKNISRNNSGSVSSLQNVKANSFSLEELAVLKNWRLLFWMTKEQSRGWIFLNDFMENRAMLNAACSNGYSGVRLKELSPAIKTSLQRNKLQIDIHFKGTSTLMETTCSYDLMKPDAIHRIEKDVENTIIKSVESMIHKSIEEEIDMTGIAATFHRQHPKQWKTLQKNWLSYLENADIQMTADMTIETPGMRFNHAEIKS